jgi:prepilin-type N-terminal cleavage/methylation domain-containing protein/prepilin-type processing-associated H-X9-DG protein
MLRRRAFTLIELLVVVAIIALLLAILVPSLAAARAQTKRVKCQSNLRTIGHAVQFYLQDFHDTFPEADFYGCLGYIGRSTAHALLGSQTPESQRPLNRYFGVTDNPFGTDPQVEYKRNDAFECPADAGDAYVAFNLSGKYFVEHGTSYPYASDCLVYPVPTFGVRSCRSLRLADVKYTPKKIVFQEPVFNPSFDMSDSRAHWHHRTRHHGNLLYADGHVEFRFTEIFDWAAPPDENNPYY